MTINLIEQEVYDTLLYIQEKYPRLTFQNKGYEYINRNEFTEEEKQADLQVNEILKKAIHKFTIFNNFCHTEKGELRIRFHYLWNEPGKITFDGVGYLSVRELLNGFDGPHEVITPQN